MNIRPSHQLISIILFSFLTLLISADISFSADEESCVLCHRHKNLIVEDDDGNLRSFNIDNDHYKESVHKKVVCRGCHTNITEIPHKKTYKKVNCGIQCHLQTAFATASFSHSKTYDNYMTSSHGNNHEDAPNCLYCHPKNKKKSKKKKTRLEVLALCAGCHDDDAVMEKYGIAPNLVSNYTTSTHGKIFFLEQKSAPTCTDCHTSHSIIPKQIPTSPVSKDKLFKTCAGQEAAVDSKGCHAVSSPDFVQSFSHKKNKASGLKAGIWFGGIIDFLTLGIFYIFCIINILRILRD